MDTALLGRLAEAQARAEARMIEGTLPDYLAIRWSVDHVAVKTYAKALADHVRGRRPKPLPESLWTAGFLTALELVSADEASKS